MNELDNYDLLFIFWGFFLQIALIIHFALRKWYFDKYIMQYGWIVYALAIPAFGISIIIFFGGKIWWLWLSGCLFLIWTVLGYVVEYVKKIEWRNPIRWPIMGPYIFLYFATIMFYWWPLARIRKSLWYAYTILFIIATVLNVTSHEGSKEGKGQK
jgi:hypothetical protein